MTLLNQLNITGLCMLKKEKKFRVEIKPNRERKIAGDLLEMATKQKSCGWCKSVKESRRGEEGPLYMVHK